MTRKRFRRRLAILLLAGGATFGLALPGPAEEPDAASGHPQPPVEVKAFASAGFSLNFNHPASGLNAFRVFDYADRALKLDVVEVVVQKPCAARGEWGFRLDLEAGGSIPRVEAASGLFRSPKTGRAGDFDIQQAFLSYIVPFGSGLRLDAGKYVSPMGYEVIPGYDGYNDFATSSFLFGYAIPFTHTGLRLGYAFSGHLSGQVHIVQGWDNFRDNNSAKSVGAGLTWVPDKTLSITLNGMVGPEQKDNDHNERVVGDLVVSWKPTGRVSLGLNVDSGYEASALGPGADAVWRGAALYAVLALSEKLSVGVRGEVFEDRDGTRTGLAQTLSELTLTPQFKPNRFMVVRADFRLDGSNRKAFETETGFVRPQPTICLNVLLIY